MKATILVVDDEVMIRRALEKFLADQGYRVLAAGSYEEALQCSAAAVVDCALVDLIMPGRNGVELIHALQERDPELMCIVLTGFGTIASAVEAIKDGAFHYLTKPFELDDILQLVQRALDHRRLRTENRTLKTQLRKQYRFDQIVGQSDAMRGIFSLIEKVAETDSTVLLLGESGTGKELVARAIHYNSHRAEKPLVTVNCAAIPEDLLESELFGHMRGSFTGATANHRGKFEVASGGTIFLDEIGDMSPKLQVKILRVLQERRFEPVGSTQTQEVNVRIIAATNRDLERAVREQRFREDLYYRLNVIPVKLPSLRERRHDVALLIDHFLRRFNQENERRVDSVSASAMECLLQYPWPGNVRELENMMERLVILKSQGTIELEDLPAQLHGGAWTFQAPSVDFPESGFSLKAAVMEFEHQLIRRALQKSGGNKNKAAGLLQLNRTTLVEKIKKQRHLQKGLSN